MRAVNITIGDLYAVKVNGRVVPVRVLDAYEINGRVRWECRNETTGRTITVRSAQRFRRRLDENSKKDEEGRPLLSDADFERIHWMTKEERAALPPEVLEAYRNTSGWHFGQRQRILPQHVDAIRVGGKTIDQLRQEGQLGQGEKEPTDGP